VKRAIPFALLALIATGPARGEEITDPQYAGNWALKSLDWERAWRKGYTGKGVRIAAMTGMRCWDPRLKANVWFNAGEDLNGNGRRDASEVNGVDDDENGCIDDFHGCNFGREGPPFRGTAGAGRDLCTMPTPGHDVQALGMAVQPIDGLLNVGVAPDAEIVAFRGEGRNLLEHGYPYLRRLGVMSIVKPALGLSTRQPSGVAMPAPEACHRWRRSWTERSAVALAAFLDRRHPFLLWGQSDAFPACDASNLALIAVEPDGFTRASNDPARYPNPYVDFAVPGSDGRANRGRARLSWGFPVLAGVIAVIQQAFPEADRDDLFEILRRSARRRGVEPFDASGRNGYLGFGQVNLGRAVEIAEQMRGSD
jgi:hypothetical protein